MPSSNVHFLALARYKKSTEAAKDVKRDLFRSCRAAVEEAGERLAGFAIVTWDLDGNLRTSYNAKNGIIGPALVPTLAQDALNRHVAVKLAAAEAEAEGG